MKRRAIIIFIFSGLVLIGSVMAALFWNGIILLNNPSEKEYPVRGVDVSSYQGAIDWKTLASQDISFAFIKATEGSSFVDANFSYNFEQALTEELRVGAYHFFSYDSSGETQAENFINTVPKRQGMLPPVIDIEFYGDKEKNPPDKQSTLDILTALIEKLETHYGMKPIIYATEKSYELYIAGSFYECDIWIRNVISSPSLSDGRDWTFWQYTNRETLDGYDGKERFIDMNVFHGTKEEFERYMR